jgi:type I restriction enzyme, S subunit
MNQTFLLAHFDRLSAAPGAIQRLRSFILDLAVRGKLLSQQTSDEPASELLKQIQVELASLVRAGKIRKEKPLPPINTDGLPYQAPSGWLWARLSQITRRIHYGFTASANPLLTDVRLLRITDIQDNAVDWPSVPGVEISKRDIEQYNLEKGDILVARTGGTIGKTFLVNDLPVTAIFASYLIRVQGAAALYDRYLKLFLESPVYWKQLEEGSRGGGQPNVNGKTLGRMIVPLPPVAEQRRIVTKVDEMMALCDRLAVSQREQEERRERVSSSALHHLTNGASSETFRQSSSFYLEHLADFTASPLQIPELRRAILSLAIRGRLVPQNQTEETAQSLIRRVQAEKSRRIEAGNLRKEKLLAAISQEEIPFTIPESWAWARIGTCALLTEYGTSVKSDENEDGIPVLAMGDIQDGQVVLRARKKVPRQIEDLPQLFLKRFDLLYNRTNSAELVGKTGIYLGDDDAYTFASYLIRIRFLSELVDPTYVNLAMNAPYFRATQIVPELRQQCGQANVNGTKLRNMLIPLPPIAEQHRIVKRVTELLTLCDQLEIQLTEVNLGKVSFLDSILYHAINDRQMDTVASAPAFAMQHSV